MFERYTERSRRAVFYARDHSIRRGATQIEAEHLFCGLLETRSPMLTAVFAELGLTLEAAWAGIDRVLPVTWSGPLPENDVPLGPDAKRVLDLASTEMLRSGDSHLDEGHLLLAVLRARDRSALIALGGLDLDLDAVGLAVQRLRQGSFRP